MYVWDGCCGHCHGCCRATCEAGVYAAHGCVKVREFVLIVILGRVVFLCGVIVYGVVISIVHGVP